MCFSRKEVGIRLSVIQYVHILHCQIGILLQEYFFVCYLIVYSVTPYLFHVTSVPRNFIPQPRRGARRDSNVPMSVFRHKTKLLVLCMKLYMNNG